MKPTTAQPIFKDVDEYFEFCSKYKVYGKAAIDLKKQLDKLTNIPEPAIKPKS